MSLRAFILLLFCWAVQVPPDGCLRPLLGGASSAAGECRWPDEDGDDDEGVPGSGGAWDGLPPLPSFARPSSGPDGRREVTDWVTRLHRLLI
jgi:hypothetical protein